MRSGMLPSRGRALSPARCFIKPWNPEPTPTLFGSYEERIVKAGMETVGGYFNDRLAEIFAGVAPSPGVLRNSSNTPLYLLCFAVGSERGKHIALRIAEHLLGPLR